MFWVSPLLAALVPRYAELRVEIGQWVNGNEQAIGRLVWGGPD